ncbi:hypothetical protein GCM10023075_56190 [Streptosporangium album]
MERLRRGGEGRGVRPVAEAALALTQEDKSRPAGIAAFHCLLPTGWIDGLPVEQARIIAHREVVQATVSYPAVPNVLHVFRHPFILKVPYGPPWEKG